MSEDLGLERALGSAVRRRTPLAGGSISAAERLELDDERVVFAKTREGATAAEFEAEAAALRWLAEPGAANVAEILAVGEDPPALALQWIEPGSLSAAGAERFGRALAELHLAGAERFGSLPPGTPEPVLCIGPLQLPATERQSWGEVYARDLLTPMLARAVQQGSIDAAGSAAVERVCERIADLSGPAEPPARLHGDLWSGNVLADSAGEAWLIDPAAYGGHREVDLSMLRLFGSPSPRILDAYRERAPLAAGDDDRAELWQLFPLLVHAVLFGGSYGESAGRVARRYA